MMAKFLLGLVIIAFTSFCGYLLSKKYHRRKTFFTRFNEFNERFLNEMSYYRRPLTEFFSKYEYKKEFKFLLDDYIQMLRNGQTSLEKALGTADYDFLKKEERSFICDYFYMLGKGDSVSQKAFFGSVKESLKKQESEAIIMSKKYGDLYIKLGFLCGLFILILII